ncbi:hypothetical protein SISNIDRAFT_486991 [Sistotremastrum niveocremeum HHB9708]|uniref:Uncharacterized protein n=1 Tax=Sistotremastrum niveocremeum HHB9708 TaxID=1314777 RepID=A0A164T408_9AGAM|nr:hypothetical protein SISNIDRAFT_486991 [Sistotremastrum niveocremeum HHB9708]
MTRWCRDHCRVLVRRSHESHREFFPAWVFFTSLDPGNEDLRGYRSDSHEQNVARVLSSFDRDRKLGDREDVFASAVVKCKSLLRDDRSETVTRILSPDIRSSVLRSLLQNPIFSWGGIKDIVAFITRGNEVAVLEELVEFFSNLPDIKPVGRYIELLVIDFLSFLIPSLPSMFTLPRPFDLAPTLALLLRYPSEIENSLWPYSDALIYFLDHGGFEQLSSLRPAYDFFQLCLTLPSDDGPTSTSSQGRARFYLEPHWGLIALPPPSHEELQNLVNALQSYQNDMASEDLEKNFVDAVIECDYLAREGSQLEMKALLHQVDRVSLLGLL